MRKTLFHILTIIWMAMIPSSCITDDNEEPSTGIELKIGDKIPSFSITMNDGTTVTNQSLAGKVSMIVFFHTACKDCQKELPIIQEFHDNHPETPVICISRAEDKQSIAKYWKTNQLSLPYSAQEDREIFSLFAYQTIPRIYVIDTRSTIRKIFTDNPLAKYEDLETSVNDAREI